MRRYSVALALLLAGCDTSMPKYDWHLQDPSRPSNTAKLETDQNECLEIANRAGQDAAVIFWYTAKLTRKNTFKDCMESRGWAKK